MAIDDSTRIYTNIGAYNALAALRSVNRSYAKVQLQLSTGLRINEVGDDPAGFTISTLLRSRIRGMTVALDNVGTAKNVLSVAEGGMQNISDILLTMKDKITQAASDTFGSSERNAIKTEIDQLTGEIDDIVDETTFNDKPLIDGTYTGVSIQTGEKPGNRLRINLGQSMKSQALNVSSVQVSARISSASGASIALSKVNSAIDKVTENLQSVGSLNSRLSFKETSLQMSITNTDSTVGRIRDADMAKLQLEAAKMLILQNTSTAALAQANLFPYSVLSLLSS